MGKAARTLSAEVLDAARTSKTALAQASKHKWGLMAQKKRPRTDEYGPLQPVIARVDVLLLRDLVQEDGLQKVCEQVGVAQQTLLRVLAGFGERCKPSSTQALRAFLTKLNS